MFALLKFNFQYLYFTPNAYVHTSKQTLSDRFKETFLTRLTRFVYQKDVAYLSSASDGLSILKIIVCPILLFLLFEHAGCEHFT